MTRETRKAVIIIFLLISFFITIQVLVKGVTEKPLNIPIKTTLGFELAKEFEVTYPGEYSLELMLEKVNSASLKEIQDVIGHGGINKYTGELIGKYKKYNITWEVKSNAVTLSGIGSHLIRGAKYSRDKISKNIGVMTLPKGKMTLYIKFKTDLSELLKYKPRLVITPGGVGAKKMQSSYAGYIVLLSNLSWLALVFGIPILIIRLIYLYAKKLL